MYYEKSIKKGIWNTQFDDTAATVAQNLCKGKILQVLADPRKKV